MQDIEQANLDPYARAIDRLTWWAVMAHDRMLSLGTGRPVTIKSHEISVSRARCSPEHGQPRSLQDSTHSRRLPCRPTRRFGS